MHFFLSASIKDMFSTIEASARETLIVVFLFVFSDLIASVSVF